MSTVAAMQTYKVVLQRETFDLGASVNSILTPFNILEEQEGYRFKLTKPKECYAYGDEDKIKQVLSNLINNAVKYCGKDKVVIINIKRVGKKFRVEVSDHGPGISQKELPHVWDRYYKASSNYVRSTTGTGLGLSIVKEILTLHHADYGVNSRLGKGTTFWFELPLMKKDRDKEEERAKGRPMDPAVIEEIK
jgi:signal transduction histidine kinase